MIVTNTAVPSAPTMERIVLFMAVPCGMSAGGRPFMAAVVSGMDTIDCPAMSTA